MEKIDVLDRLDHGRVIVVTRGGAGSGSKEGGGFYYLKGGRARGIEDGGGRRSIGWHGEVMTEGC